MSTIGLYGSSGATLFPDEETWLNRDKNETEAKRDDSRENDWPANPLTGEELVITSSLLLK